MTIERKLVIALDDIKALVFECIMCLSRVSVPPRAGNVQIPRECPQCHRKWSLLDLSQYEHVASPFVNFTTSVQQLQSFPKEVIDMAGFRVLLEIEEPRMP
jgi:hypothetical protein